MKAAAARAILLVSLAAACWSAAVVLSGGIDLRRAGVGVMARTPWPTVATAAVLIALHLAWRRSAVLEDANAVFEGLARQATVAAFGLALVTGAAAVRFGTFAVGGSDSNCYVEQAERWAAGTMLAPVQPGFASDWPDAALSLTPTGFVPSRRVAGAIAPICPSGLSLMMAGPRLLGAPRVSVFLVVPLFAGVAVFCTFLLGRRLSGRLGGLAAALLVATSPVLLYQAVQPMSDVPATALWLVALFCVGRAWGSSPGLTRRASETMSAGPDASASPGAQTAEAGAGCVGTESRTSGLERTPAGAGSRVCADDANRPAARWWLVAAGLASGAAVLVRPNLAPLALVILVAGTVRWPGSRVRDGAGRLPGADGAAARGREAWWAGAWDGWPVRVALVCVGLLPAALTLGLVQSLLYGSPFSSGYGDPGLLFRARHVAANLGRYPVWLVETQSPFVLLGCVTPLVVWAVGRRRAGRDAWRPAFVLACVLWIFTAGAFAAYLPYVPFDAWWFLRFWLPGIPPLIALAVATTAAVASAAVRPAAEPGLRVAQRFSAVPPLPSVPPLLGLLGLLGCVGLASWQLGVARDRDVFDLQRFERKFVVAGEYVARLPARAVVLAVWHGGAVNYYGHRPSVTWDAIAPDGLDAVVASLRKQGREVFLLLEPWEQDAFKARFGPASAVAALDWPPRARFGNAVSLWALDDRDRFLRGEATVSERVPLTPAAAPRSPRTAPPTR